MNSPGSARRAPRGEREFNDVAQNDRRSVRGDFDDVVSGVGMRLGEVGDDDFVDALVVWCGPVWRGRPRPRYVVAI